MFASPVKYWFQILQRTLGERTTQCEWTTQPSRAASGAKHAFSLCSGWVSCGAFSAQARGRDREQRASRTQRVDSRSGRGAGCVAADSLLPDSRRASSDDSDTRRFAACAVVVDRSVAAQHAARAVEAERGSGLESVRSLTLTRQVAAVSGRAPSAKCRALSRSPRGDPDSHAERP